MVGRGCLGGSAADADKLRYWRRAMISPEKIAGPWLVLAWKLSKSGMSLRQFEAVYAPKIDSVADPVIDDRDALASELLTLRAERDEARELVAEANNSLYGSQHLRRTLSSEPHHG